MTDPRQTVSFKPREGASAPVGGGTLVLTPRAFWFIFGGTWVAYTALTFSFGVSLGEGFVEGILSAIANVAGPFIPSFVLAVRRHTLLKPGQTLGRLIVKVIVTGLAFTITATSLTYAIAWGTGRQMDNEFGNGPWAMVVALLVTEFFLYLMLMGFLLGSESLKRAHEAREVAAKEAVLRAQAEAKALRSQFNPHFVFNTLHSLMLLVRAEPETAEKAIEDVAELIRYASTLQRREVDQVPLSKEVGFVERYLDLERLRLEERLTVTWDVEDGLDDVMVPAFGLQTLVENAIKHGIAPKNEGGSIHIEVRAEGVELVVTVRDDGQGSEATRVGDNGGSGLQLLGRRVHATHSDLASLSWTTAPGQGFEARLRFPALPAEAVGSI